jgi:hypothetical protein
MNDSLDNQKEQRRKLCPSSRAEKEGSQVFGIVTGAAHAPKVNYLKVTMAIDRGLLEQTNGVAPTEIFRIASPCQESSCAHFDGHLCRLSVRIIENLPKVSKNLPTCAIRKDCRWWNQEGENACLRCPQILTDTYCPTEIDIKIAIPHTAKN